MLNFSNSTSHCKAILKHNHLPTTVGSKSTNTALGTCFPAPSFTEESVEGVITSANGLVAWHLTIWLDAVLEAVELPTGIAHLNPSLTDMDWNYFTLKTKVFQSFRNQKFMQSWFSWKNNFTSSDNSFFVSTTFFCFRNTVCFPLLKLLLGRTIRKWYKGDCTVYGNNIAIPGIAGA